MDKTDPVPKYAVLHKIGGGAFATVYRARQADLDREVAIKVLDPSMAGSVDLVGQAKLIARTKHPNVVHIYDVTRLPHPDNGIECDAIVMELLEGRQLVELLATQLDPERTRSIGHGIIAGLQYIHSCGISHGDVHAGNIIVGDDGTPRFIDFQHPESLSPLSTMTREAAHARDIRALAMQLAELLEVGAPDYTRAIDCDNRWRKLSTLPELRDAFEDALAPGRSAPQLLEAAPDSGLSQIAARLVEFLVRGSECGSEGDGVTTVSELRTLGLSDDELEDASEELEDLNLVEVQRVMGRPPYDVHVKNELFVRFDNRYMPWNPEHDAEDIARRLLDAGRGHGIHVSALAMALGWEARRMNPALSVLIQSSLVEHSDTIAHPYVCEDIIATPRLRRAARAQR